MPFKTTISAFRAITIFVLLSLTGLSFLPMLDLNYRPGRKNNTITVSYSWNGASPEIIEREVASKLEGVLATLKGVSSIYSESATNYGYIRLNFTEIEDAQQLRYEISTLIRQVSTEFPEGVTLPRVIQGGGGGNKTLLSYTLNGRYSPLELQQYAEKHIRKMFASIDGVEQVAVYGAQPVEWVMTYQLNQLKNLGISPNDLTWAVRRYLQEFPLGLADYQIVAGQSRKISIYLKPVHNTDIPWHKVPVKRVGNRVFYLNTLCTIEKQTQKARSYYRINGLNSINIVVSAGENVNELVTGKQVKKTGEKVKASLPESMSLRTTYDTTEYLQKELFSILWRIGLSIAILLLFVWLTSRSPAYLLIVITSILCNVAVAFIFYYLLGIEIQLYSLAGLTISLGIIIDNTIVMIDHLRHYQNKRVFLALMAATLTTVGALSIIFFLDENQALKLIDFAWVLAINLIVSLFISLYFVPALMDKVPVKKRSKRRTIRNKRRIVRFGRVYMVILRFISRFRVAFILLLILGFGLPVYLLPEKLADDNPETPEKWYVTLYDNTLGSENESYRENIHPFLEKWLGGSLFLFYQDVFSSSYYKEPERTRLHINGSMPPGASIEQINEVFVEWENFISQFEEVSHFETRINGIRNASITIEFKPKHEFTAFPYYLKARLQEKAIHLGGVDSSVYGVGRGFNNSLRTGYKNTNLQLRGYSYKELLTHAERLRKKLENNYSRIKEVDVLGRPNYSGITRYEYFLDTDPSEMIRQGLNLPNLHGFLSKINLAEYSVASVHLDGTLSNLKIRPKEADMLDTWNIKQHPIALSDSALAKLDGIARVGRRRAGSQIIRQNQQYQLVLFFDYIGSWQMKNKAMERFIKETNEELPIGYSIHYGGYGGWWSKEKTQYQLIGLVIAIVFLIGATLFESLRQPFIVVFMIPISFMGVFLTFYLFQLNFDQGGYASFILLSGIAVNAGFFIINDYNNLRKEHPHQAPARLYLKAYQHKILPILLTICSTVAGMIPFLIEAGEQAFWFALAAGTVGGLIFSLVAVLFFLPIVMKKKVFRALRTH